MWSAPEPIPDDDENLEDPFVTLGKFVKRSTVALWRRMRGKDRNEDDSDDWSEADVVVVTIRHPEGEGDGPSESIVGEGEQTGRSLLVKTAPVRRSSWSPSPESMPPEFGNKKRTFRKSTGALPIPSVQEMLL